MSCYFEHTYFTDYFEICSPATTRFGGYYPSQKEWESYLKKINESSKQAIAEKAADRRDLRKIIMEQIFPRKKYRKIIVRSAETRIEPLPRDVEPRYVVKQIPFPYIPDTNGELRRRLAGEFRDIRRRARRIREKKKRLEALRKLREEEALIALLL